MPLIKRERERAGWGPLTLDCGGVETRRFGKHVRERTEAAVKIHRAHVERAAIWYLAWEGERHHVQL